MLIHTYRPATLLKVSGGDALTFLQGQFTNELRQPVGAAVYGLWLNQKGKVLADSHLLRLAEDEFYAVSIESPAAVIRARLEDYIVADEVSLTDETAQVHGLSVSGAGSGEIIGQVAGGVPPAGQFARRGEAVVFAGRRRREENYELIGAAKTVADMKQKILALGAREAAAEEMEFARITNALPCIPQDLGPGDLPNEGGLEEAALSFTKGCYLGQEVMARLKNLGQVRRRLHVIRGEGAVPAPLAALYQGERKVGQVRSAAARGNEFGALAMLSLVNLDLAAGLSLGPDLAPSVQIIPHG